MNVVWAELNYCHNPCWCKNTRCSRAVLWPGADIQELLPPTPKTTPPRLACCQLAAGHRAFPSRSDPPSPPLPAGPSVIISNWWNENTEYWHPPPWPPRIRSAHSGVADSQMRWRNGEVRAPLQTWQMDLSCLSSGLMFMLRFWVFTTYSGDAAVISLV